MFTNWCCHWQLDLNIFISLILHNSRICYLQCNSSQKKKLSWLTTHWSIPFFNNWNIWIFTQSSWCAFARLCQCHLELEKAKWPLSFCFGYFFHQNFLITLPRMQASFILSWAVAIDLPISRLPPLQDTPPIIMVDLLQMINFWHGGMQPPYYMRLVFNMERFWHLVWANFTSYKFSLFPFSYSFVHFPNLWCINK